MGLRDRRITLAVVTSLKLRRITEALRCELRIFDKVWSELGSYWRCADIWVGCDGALPGGAVVPDQKFKNYNNN